MNTVIQWILDFLASNAFILIIVLMVVVCVLVIILSSSANVLYWVVGTIVLFTLFICVVRPMYMRYLVNRRRAANAHREEILDLEDAYPDPMFGSGFEAPPLAQVNSVDVDAQGSGAMQQRASRHNSGLRKAQIDQFAPEVEQLAVNSEVETCSVCLELIEVGNMKRVLRCGHEYHSACISRWLSRKPVCPLCQAPAAKEPLFPGEASPGISYPLPVHSSEQTYSPSYPVPIPPVDAMRHDDYLHGDRTAASASTWEGTAYIPATMNGYPVPAAPAPLSSSV
ncbi:E3 ubiquitin-protein ligase RLIM [Porphyridium purpureum]|uniref:E3 ubiquitin-protein ligase RLIM n=1 Tax=Porphyridium purpureum TaxID=35688 RepID=A0A5J4YY50_PORPP|nr:E3 ubiquitin-protein ligase RLIM [Porphyridium purpureum]|eukprot:POR4818..scf208_2